MKTPRKIVKSFMERRKQQARVADGFVQLRRFQKDDWMGWSGALQFPDGSEPWIGELVVNFHRGESDPFQPVPCVLIVSGEEPGFVEIDLCLENGYCKSWMCSGAAALNAAFVLRQGINSDELKKMGFGVIVEEEPDADRDQKGT